MSIGSTGVVLEAIWLVVAAAGCTPRVEDRASPGGVAGSQGETDRVGGAPVSDDAASAPGEAAAPSAPVGNRPKDAGPDRLAYSPSLCGADAALGCFVAIPGGTFHMGAQSTDPSKPRFDAMAQPDEGPVREVTVKPYWIQRSESVASHLQRCVDDGACEDFQRPPEASSASLYTPIAGVSQADAVKWCAKLGGRLPTEAEWEYAARADLDLRWPWGNPPKCPVMTDAYVAAWERRFAELARRCAPLTEAVLRSGTRQEVDKIGRAAWLLTDEVFDAACVRLRDRPQRGIVEGMLELVDALTAAVPHGRILAPECSFDRVPDAGSGLPSVPFGLMGMAGGVAEWTSGTWSGTRDTRPVLRGGSYLAADAAEWRTTARQPADAAQRSPDIGVRCVRDTAP